MNELDMGTLFGGKTRALMADQISRRASCRAYVSAPDPAQREKLHLLAADTLPGARIALFEGKNENMFMSLPLVGGVKGTNYCAAVIVDERSENALLHAGMSGEAFVLRATAMGLGTCWLKLFKRAGITVPLGEGERVEAIIALGVPEIGVRQNKRKKLTALCGSNPVEWPMWAFTAAECVRKAPSAVNRQPWRMDFSGHTLVLSGTAGADRLSLGIAALHLYAGAPEGEVVFSVGGEKEKDVAVLTAL